MEVVKASFDGSDLENLSQAKLIQWQLIESQEILEY